MAAISVISANAVDQVFPGSPGTVVRHRRALVAMTAGALYYIDPTTGSVGLCSTNTAGAHNARGICPRVVAAGDVFAGIEEGEVGGFNLSGSNFDDLVYAQDAAGTIGTTAGTTSVAIGRVSPLTDGLGYGSTPSKVLRLFRNQLTTL